MTMSNSEFRKLLINFEREYDPFGTYKTNPLTDIYIIDAESGTAQPNWISGKVDSDGNYTDGGSHELITARACGIMFNDKGFWGTNESNSMLLALTVSLASIIPDTDLDLGVGQLFAGHFYDPDDGDNWLGFTTNTAKTNAEDNYGNALNEYRKYGLSENFIESVGKMLHYVQDVCVPHHAANVTGANLSHTAFEEYADENLDSYIDSLTTLSNWTYTSGNDKDIGTIVHNAAVYAKADISLVNNVFNKSNWEEIANKTTRQAVINSVIVLYKLSQEGNIPLTK